MWVWDLVLFVLGIGAGFLLSEFANRLLDKYGAFGGSKKKSKGGYRYVPRVR